MTQTLDLLDDVAEAAASSLADEDVRAAVVKLLRLTPLAVLLQRRTQLVAVLSAMPETDRFLRPTWERQDWRGTARLYIWVEGARRRTTRATGHRSATRETREVDFYPAA